ncbi:MAG: zinc ribbon domain-containing protein [Proteobacteria bacterium]|nr:zinc ribbon domain-containing protein [Pseudomonadota bacterium]
MPIYEFKCKSCGSDFEELVFGSDERVPCPECESGDVFRKPSAFAIKSGDKFVPASGSSCSGCTPGPSGCSGCSH